MAEKKLVITQKALAERIKELGAAITQDYGQNQLVVVGILNGAFMFMADLVREIKREIEIDFVRLASYGQAVSPSTLRFTKDMELDVQGKDILVVEDIIDTGHTLAYLNRCFADRGAHSVRFCVLIDKRIRRELTVPIAYTGFVVEDGFLVGYGLDCREQHRQHADIYRLQDK